MERKIKKSISGNNRKVYLGQVNQLDESYLIVRTIRKLLFPRDQVTDNRKLKSRSNLCSLATLIEIAPGYIMSRIENRRYGYKDIDLLDALRFIATFDYQKKKRELASVAYKNLLAYKKYIILPNGTLYRPPNYNAQPFYPKYKGWYSY